MIVPRGIISGIILGGIAIGLLGSLLSWGSRGYREAEANRARADSLATEIVIERARADGWEARAADTTTVLLELLAASDSQAATLARELEAARARPVSRTVLVASSSGAAEAPADHFTNSGDPDALLAPDSATSDVRDGPLSARITYFPAPQLFRLDWSVEISAELIHAEGPDRRGLVFARSPDPRVRLEIPAFEYTLPAIERSGFPWGWIGAAAVGGYLAGRVF